MKMKRIAGILAAVILMIAISGCAMGNKGTMHYSRTTTIGQELIDLKEAKDKGALSEQEYNKAKEQLLKYCAPVKLEYSLDKKDKCSAD